MPTLYVLLEGKITRKDHAGKYVDLKSPCRLVPSPSELAAEGYRLRPVGKVDWKHPEALAAVQNTNKDDYPDFGKGGDAGIFAPPAAEVDNICAVDVATALKVISGVTSIETLDKYTLQEIENKPRIRKAIIKALDDRRAALGDGGTADTAQA